MVTHMVTFHGILRILGILGWWDTRVEPRLGALSFGLVIWHQVGFLRPWADLSGQNGRVNSWTYLDVYWIAEFCQHFLTLEHLSFMDAWRTCPGNVQFAMYRQSPKTIHANNVQFYPGANPASESRIKICRLRSAGWKRQMSLGSESILNWSNVCCEKSYGRLRTRHWGCQKPVTRLGTARPMLALTVSCHRQSRLGFREFLENSLNRVSENLHCTPCIFARDEELLLLLLLVRGKGKVCNGHFK